MSDAKLAPIDRIRSKPFCRVIEAAGHEVLFSYEHHGMNTMYSASICYPGIGLIKYDHKVARSQRGAEDWLATRDKDAARRALEKINEVIVKTGLDKAFE